jgi:hypothetical protein
MGGLRGKVENENEVEVEDEGEVENENEVEVESEGEAVIKRDVAPQHCVEGRAAYICMPLVEDCGIPSGAESWKLD